MTDAVQDTFDALDDLLDREKAALLDGDLEMIARLYDRKLELIDTLSEMEREDIGRLQALNNKASRNQDLLDSALDGIRSVAQRLAQVRETRTSLQTYDSSGRKKSIEMKHSASVEKRA